MVMSGHDTRDSIRKRNNNKKRPVVKPEFNFVGGGVCVTMHFICICDRT